MKIKNNFNRKLHAFFLKCYHAILPDKQAIPFTVILQTVLAILAWIFITIVLHEKNIFWFISPAFLLLGIVCAALLSFLLVGLMRLIQIIPRQLIWSVCFTTVIAALTSLLVSNYWTFSLSIALWLVVPALLIGLGKGYFTKQAKHKAIYHILGWLFIVSGSLFILAGVFWLSIPGFSRSDANQQISDHRNPVQQIQAANPATFGPYMVNTLTYGSGNDRLRPEYGEQVRFITQPVDGSPFLPTLKKLPAWFYEKQWGVDFSNLPLNGRVWYPQGDGPFPLVLIVHGNHTAEDYSDSGYAYLGELLASRGLITVSVDENFFNSNWISLFNDGISGQENDARGWLLLQHLQQWREWSGDPDHLFYQKVDLQRIALIGHSRGGEAITEAAAFNALGIYPDNGNVLFPAPFGIRALVAIAPVDTQYNPAGQNTPLQDVDYLVLQGSADADVNSFAGLSTYARIQYTNPEAFHFKSAIYIHRANHGQFNSTWGSADNGKLSQYFLDRKNLISAQDQEIIAQVFISAFLEASLHEDDTYLPLFKESRSGAAWLPQATLWTQYGDSAETLMATFEEDINLHTASISNAAIDAKKFSSWKEILLKGQWENSLDTNVVNLKWTAQTEKQPHYDLIFHQPLSLNQEQVLLFSAAVQAENNADTQSEETNTAVNFSIQLSDGNQEATLTIEPYALLYPNPAISVMKAAWLAEKADPEIIMQSIEIPIQDFSKLNPALDLSNIRSIRFIFDQTGSGNIWLDNIGYR